MDSAEWYETVFVVGKRLNAGTFDNRNCKVFDKNGFHWVVEEQFYRRLKLPEDPCKWDQVYEYYDFSLKNYSSKLNKILYINHKIDH